MVDPVLWIPVAFLIGYEKGAVRVAAYSVSSPKAMGEYFTAFAISRYLDQGAMMRDKLRAGMAGTLGVIEITLLRPSASPMANSWKCSVT